MTGLQDLPTDLLGYILRDFSFRQILTLRTVSKFFLQLINEEEFWQTQLSLRGMSLPSRCCGWFDGAKVVLSQVGWIGAMDSKYCKVVMDLFEQLHIPAKSFLIETSVPRLEILRCSILVVGTDAPGVPTTIKKELESVLDEAVDLGIPVIYTTFSNDMLGMLQIKGKYAVFPAGENHTTASPHKISLNSLCPPEVSSGVSILEAGKSGYHCRCLDQEEGIHTWGSWSCGCDFIRVGWKAPGRTPVVLLNMFLPSSVARSDFWPKESDFGVLLKNLIRWCLQGV